MRVLNVQLKHIHGGNPQVCLDYTRMLKASGNQVTVLTNPADPFLARQQEIADSVIPSKYLGKHGAYDLLAILYFKKIIKLTQPEVIILHEGRSASLFKRAAGGSIPLIDVNHGRSPKQSKGMSASIVINGFQKKRSETFLGEETPVFIVPNSIDIIPDKKAKPAKNWQNPPVIGTMGRLVGDKAYDVFIESLAILKEQGIPFKAKMAGEGEERAALEAQIQQYGLQDRVEMIGWLENTAGFYDGIDIFCLPSRKEEFGLVILEAYKHQLPVVVSNAEGPSEIVTPDVDGLVVAKENPKQLAAALCYLLEHKEQADALALRGRQKAEKRYAVGVVAKTLQQVLEACVRVPQLREVV